MTNISQSTADKSSLRKYRKSENKRYTSYTMNHEKVLDKMQTCFFQPFSMQHRAVPTCACPCARTRARVCVWAGERDSYVPWYPTRGQTAAVTTFIPLEPKRNAVKWPTPLLHKVASPEKPNCYLDLGPKYATRIRGISAAFWKLRMLSVMWQKDTRLCRQTMADVSGFHSAVLSHWVFVSPAP